MAKLQFWCQTCQKKYWLDNPKVINPRIIQEKPPFLDHESTFKPKTKPVFGKYKGVVKCTNCGFLMQEITNNEASPNHSG